MEINELLPIHRTIVLESKDDKELVILVTVDPCGTLSSSFAVMTKGICVRYANLLDTLKEYNK